MKKVLVTILLIAVMLTSFVACSKKDAAAVKEEPQVNYKEKVIIGIKDKVTTTNPLAQSSVAHRILFNLTHNTLVGYDEANKAILPELATEWKSNADFTVWTFTLRNDVTFHNGEKLTADDFVFTWEFAKANASNATVKSAYNKMKSVKAIDDTHVEITLAKGDIDYLYGLTNEYMGVLNREAVTADEKNGPSIGTGAFVVTEFVLADHCTFTRNDNFWGTAPTTKVLEFVYKSDGTARLAALEAGEVDVCQGPNFTELDIIKANEELGLTIYAGGSLTYLAFNLDDPVLQDQNLRLAIAYAINDQEIIDGAASGQGKVANGMWGYFQYGYFEDWTSVGKTAYNPQNVAKAKEYLAKSKYPNGGVKIKFSCSSAWTATSLQIIQAQLKAALNIDVEVEQLDSAGFSKKTAARDFQVAITAVTFTAAGSDAARVLTPGNTANYANYNNARVNELFNLGGAETNDAKRQSYYKEIQTIVHDECPMIPLYYGNSGAAYIKTLSGAIWNTTGMFDYTYVKVAEK